MNEPPAAVLVLSPRNWAHVAVALANHAAMLEAKGDTLPREVCVLMETAAKLARSGQLVDRSGQRQGAGAMVCDGHLVDGDRCIGLEDAARRVSVSARTLRRHAQSGGLPSHKIGRRRVVRIRDLHRWVDTQTESR
jgi:excisionase family DNA binding protein